MLSEKNQMLSPAVADLGLGDQLTQQLEDQEAARKKKMLSANSTLMGSVGSLATQTLFPGGASG